MFVLLDVLGGLGVVTLWSAGHDIINHPCEGYSQRTVILGMAFTLWIFVVLFGLALFA